MGGSEGLLTTSELKPVLVPDHLLADDAKDDGRGVALPLGLHSYSSSYVIAFGFDRSYIPS